LIHEKEHHVSQFASVDITNSNRVTLSVHPVAGDVAVLHADGGDATVALEGAQVIDWTPRDHKPVLWLSPGRAGAGKAVRGGVPVCWPWFADHATDANKPAHGFVRTRRWQIVNVEVTEQATRITLSTATEPTDKAMWVHDARLTLTVTLAETLQLELTTHNVGSQMFSFTQALHTYFAVSDIDNVTVDGFDGQSYADKLDGFARKQQSGLIEFPGEVDRIYDEHRSAAVIVDRDFQRQIEIQKSGSRSSVVWNPGASKGARLGDLGEKGWRRFVCVETCNAGTDIMTVAPHQHHTLTAIFKVQRL
jgi:glucose-6-phosphate 1-epimerase